MTSVIDFANECAALAPWPASTSWQQALATVKLVEGAHAYFNPMDSILFEPGATAYNSFGPRGQWHVWNYANLASGVRATVATIHGWPNVAAVLEATGSAFEIIAAIDQVAEGHPSNVYAPALPQVLSTWPKYGQVLIAGSSPDPIPKASEGMTYVTATDHPADQPEAWVVTEDGRRIPVRTPAQEVCKDFCTKVVEGPYWAGLLVFPVAT